MQIAFQYDFNVAPGIQCHHISSLLVTKLIELKETITWTDAMEHILSFNVETSGFMTNIFGDKFWYFCSNYFSGTLQEKFDNNSKLINLCLEHLFCSYIN